MSDQGKRDQTYHGGKTINLLVDSDRSAILKKYP